MTSDKMYKLHDLLNGYIESKPFISLNVYAASMLLGLG